MSSQGTSEWEKNEPGVSRLIDRWTQDFDKIDWVSTQAPCGLFSRRNPAQTETGLDLEGQWRNFRTATAMLDSIAFRVALTYPCASR